MKTIVVVLAAISMLVLGGCNNPHECKPGDVDKDHDGLCHEK